MFAKENLITAGRKKHTGGRQVQKKPYLCNLLLRYHANAVRSSYSHGGNPSSLHGLESILCDFKLLSENILPQPRNKSHLTRQITLRQSPPSSASTFLQFLKRFSQMILPHQNKQQRGTKSTKRIWHPAFSQKSNIRTSSAWMDSTPDSRIARSTDFKATALLSPKQGYLQSRDT